MGVHGPRREPSLLKRFWGCSSSRRSIGSIGVAAVVAEGAPGGGAAAGCPRPGRAPGAGDVTAVSRCGPLGASASPPVAGLGTLPPGRVHRGNPPGMSRPTPVELIDFLGLVSARRLTEPSQVVGAGVSGTLPPRRCILRIRRVAGDREAGRWRNGTAGPTSVIRIPAPWVIRP